MNAYPNAPQAWDRTRQMAHRLGVDLPRAMFDGWLTRRDLDGILCACEACTQTPCLPAAAPDLPGLCATRSDLESLRF